MRFLPEARLDAMLARASGSPAGTVRLPAPRFAPGLRLARPELAVELGYGAELAEKEASRCLDCGVAPVFDGTRCVLCGGCADVCPTGCLKLVDLDAIDLTHEAPGAFRGLRGGAGPGERSAILKDEDTCIRCGLCAARCPTEAVTMERVVFSTIWRST